MTHICVRNLTIIGSDNGLSPGRHQAINWTNAGILLIGPLGTDFSEITIGIQTFSFKEMHLKMPYAKWRPFCLGLNVLIKAPVPSSNKNHQPKQPYRTIKETLPKWHLPLKIMRPLKHLANVIVNDKLNEPKTIMQASDSRRFESQALHLSVNWSPSF